MNTITRTLTLPPMGKTPSETAALWLSCASRTEQDFWEMPPSELTMQCLSYASPRPYGCEATTKKVSDWNRNVSTARRALGAIVELLPPGSLRDSDVPGVVNLVLWHSARLAFFSRPGR